MLDVRELAGMDAEALRSYIGVLHEALALHSRANALSQQLVNRTMGMNRQVSRMSPDNPMQQLARALAGNAR